MTDNIARSRWAVGGFFFLHGLCFSSWGARIPAIQTQLNLSEAELGTVLFAIPIGSLLSMPLAAGVTNAWGSHRVLPVAILFYSLMLVTLGWADSAWALSACLMVFGCMGNMVNVSVNTQAVAVESVLNRSVMASLHGLWSLAGFCGAALGTVMIGADVAPKNHFAIVMGIALAILLVVSRYLLKESRSKEPQPLFVLPQGKLIGLGLIAFCSMICEGAMFDWSGVYFKNVIEVKAAWVGLGYTAFMTTMAGTRFIADSLITRFGLRSILKSSAVMIVGGLLIAIIYPSFTTGIIGFFMVGAGTSAVVPLVFSEAGKAKIMPSSSAIAAVSTIGFLGFLIGPPLIGWIAGATSLRISFAVIALMGLAIYFLAERQYKNDSRT
jgi:MFS family permease